MTSTTKVYREEVEQRVCPELHPLLSFELPTDWRLSLNRQCVKFFYKNNHARDLSLMITHYEGIYMTWYAGIEDKRFGTLQQAFERLTIFMGPTEIEVRGIELACIRTTQHPGRLIDRDGVGWKTLYALARAYPDDESFRGASLSDLEAVKGIGKDTAWLIGDHLYSNVNYHMLWDGERSEWVSLYPVPKSVLQRCALSLRYLTAKERNKYKLSAKEIKDRGLVKVKPQ